MEKKTSRLVHPLRPVFDKRSRILILGTFPSVKSRETGFYYGNPHNRFFPVLAALFGRPVPEGTENRRCFLLENRIAVFDVLRSCEIRGSADASIKAPEPNDLTEILQTADIRAIALAAVGEAGLCYDLVLASDILPAAIDAAAAVPGLTFVLDHLGNPRTGGPPEPRWAADIRALAANGKKAGELYRRYCKEAVERPALCLPSTSPANAGMTLEKLIGVWKVLLEYLKE